MVLKLFRKKLGAKPGKGLSNRVLTNVKEVLNNIENL